MQLKYRIKHQTSLKKNKTIYKSNISENWYLNQNKANKKYKNIRSIQIRKTFIEKTEKKKEKKCLKDKKFQPKK